LGLSHDIIISKYKLRKMRTEAAEIMTGHIPKHLKKLVTVNWFFIVDFSLAKYYHINKYIKVLLSGEGKGLAR
jgi:hypothetical protein